MNGTKRRRNGDCTAAPTMTSRSALPCLLCLLTAVAGCGSDEPDGPGSNASSTGNPQPTPPSWTEAPTEPVMIGQGKTVTLPLTIVTESQVQSAIFEAPAGLEAASGTDGLDIYASYAAQPGTPPVVVSLPDPPNPHVVYPVELDVRPIGWLPRVTWTDAEGPEAREHGAVIVDGDGRQAFVIQGSGYSPQFVPLADSWRFDLNSHGWNEVQATGDLPQAAGSRRAAGSADPSVFYLFGGYGEGNVNFDELYRVRVDGTSLVFTEMDQVNTPPARALHAFAYDAEKDRYVMFGGASTKPLDDLWTMTIAGDTATWTEVTPALSPSARYGFFYGVDEARGQLYLYSGAQGFASVNPADDTWVLDMRADPPAWTLLLEGEGAVPPGRRNGCTVFDPTGPRMFVFGGTPDGQTTVEGLWAFDARPGKARWEQLVRDGEPPRRSSGFGFFDPGSGQSYLGFGNDSNIYRDWNVIGYPTP